MLNLSIWLLIFFVNQDGDGQVANTVTGNVYARHEDIATVRCNVDYPSAQTLQWFELEQSADPNPTPVYTNVNNPGNTTKNPDKYTMVLGPRYDLAMKVTRPENSHYCVVKDATGNEVSRPNFWLFSPTDGPTCQDQVLRVSVNARASLVCRQGSQAREYPMEWYSDDGTLLERRKEYITETKHIYVTMTHEFVVNAGHNGKWFRCTLFPRELGPNDITTFDDATCFTRIEIV